MSIPYHTPDIQNCHSRHAPSQPSVELCCSLALKMSLKQQYWTSQDETNHIKEAKTTWLFWEGQNKWIPCRSWLCPPRLKYPHGTHTPWGGGRNPGRKGQWKHLRLDGLEGRGCKSLRFTSSAGDHMCWAKAVPSNPLKIVHKTLTQKMCKITWFSLGGWST